MVVSVRLLGDFQVDVEGRIVAAKAFSRRGAASLVKLLALEPSRQLHRERVMDALWPDAAMDDAANALYKAAHFARRTTGSTSSLVLKNEMVALFPDDDVRVDVQEFEATAREVLATRDPSAADVTLEQWDGDLLPADLFAEWAAQPRQRVELLRRELLRLAGRWSELVTMDPTDEQAALGFARDLLERGDRAGSLREIHRIERVLRDVVGIGLSPESYDLRSEALETVVSLPTLKTSPTVLGQAGPQSAPRHASLATQTLGFCRARDGVRLAYASSGQGAPLVKVANWLTHLDFDWASPVWSHWWHELSRDRRLIRYDERGCGLSDWDVDSDSFTLEAWVRDLETVVDTIGLERFDLFGMSQGGPIAVTYAARHPERVSKLIVYGTCAQATWGRASPAQRDELATLGQLIRQSWGSDQPGFRQIYDARFLPDGPLELWRAFDHLQRLSTSPINAYRLWRAFGHLEAADAARSLELPTMVLHSRHDQVWSFDEAAALHAMVPGSRLVELDSRNHILRGDEPAFAQLIAEIRGFLDAPQGARA